MLYPRRKYRAALSSNSVEDARLRQANKELKKSLDKRMQEGKPIAKYDLAARRAYLEYADGRIVFIKEKT